METIEKLKQHQARLNEKVFVPEEREGHRIALWCRTNFPDVGLILASNQKTEVSEMIAGLDQGADDFFVKGDPAQLLAAKVRSVLGRRRFEHGSQLEFGRFALNFRYRTLSFDSEEIILTDAEYRVMEALCSAPNTVLSRSALYEKAFLRTVEFGREEAEGRAIDTLIKNIRKNAAEVATEVVPIASVYGKGYRLQVD